MAAAAASGPAVAGEPRHGLRILLVWLVASVAVDLVIWFVWGPHLPPGHMSSSAQSQQFDFKVLGVVAAPVMLLIYVYFGYALTFWRQRPGDEEDGPATLPGAARVQAIWISITTVLVLLVFAFGTYELAAPAGAGAGEGSSPLFKPSGKPFQVQVIAQQWLFTYRYPSYGGMETRQLNLPANVPIEFHVTSLDVIHSFWAIQLGVKADAVQDVDNVAYTTAKHAGAFEVRCAELCGLWHGAMFNSGEVMTDAAFRSWATRTETQLTAATKVLPPYSLSYSPNELKGLAKLYYAAGINGAGGDYYGLNYPNQP
jgi:cytochrome c oxidase subunit 2